MRNAVASAVVILCCLLPLAVLVADAARANEAPGYLLAWGRQGSGNGQFLFPHSIACAPSGRVYVGDTANHRVQVFDLEGNFLFLWGSRGTTAGKFDTVAGSRSLPPGTSTSRAIIVRRGSLPTELT